MEKTGSAFKKIYLVLPAAVLIAVSSLVLARVAFGYDPFDRSGWYVSEDGTRRYLDRSGDALVGWQEVDGLVYCFSDDGAMHTGWLEADGGLYYLDGEGQKTVGWAEVEGKRRYFAPDGFMCTGWQEIRGSRYYFDPDGGVHTGWLESEDGRYYLDEQGTPCTGWAEAEGERFYFSEDGLMQTGWIETDRGLCYLSQSGAVTAGWADTDRGRFFIREDGTLHTGWLDEGGVRYYMDEKGVQHTGWLELEGERYWFRDDGTMAVGEVEIDGGKRHFASTGKYFVLVNPWNPVPEDHAPELVWFDGFQVDAVCVEALAEMRDACIAAGLPFDLTSAYRGVSYQTTIFQRKVDKLMAQGYTRSAAESETGRSIAIPGTSEHHLGLAVDIKSGQSTYDWLARHSWEYGFIQRYPYGDTQLTGIYYEPWHFRYVGRELAKEIYELDICLEAYVDMLTESAAGA